MSMLDHWNNYNFHEPSARKRCFICGTGTPPGVLCADHVALLVLRQAVQQGHHGDWPQPPPTSYTNYAYPSGGTPTITPPTPRLPLQPTFSHIALMTNQHLRSTFGSNWQNELRALLKRLSVDDPGDQNGT